MSEAPSPAPVDPNTALLYDWVKRTTSAGMVAAATGGLASPRFFVSSLFVLWISDVLVSSSLKLGVAEAREQFWAENKVKGSGGGGVGSGRELTYAEGLRTRHSNITARENTQQAMLKKSWYFGSRVTLFAGMMNGVEIAARVAREKDDFANWTLAGFVSSAIFSAGGEVPVAFTSDHLLFFGGRQMVSEDPLFILRSVLLSPHGFFLTATPASLSHSLLFSLCFNLDPGSSPWTPVWRQVRCSWHVRTRPFFPFFILSKTGWHFFFADWGVC